MHGSMGAFAVRVKRQTNEEPGFQSKTPINLAVAYQITVVPGKDIYDVLYSVPDLT